MLSKHQQVQHLEVRKRVNVYNYANAHLCLGCGYSLASYVWLQWNIAPRRSLAMAIIPIGRASSPSCHGEHETISDCDDHGPCVIYIS